MSEIKENASLLPYNSFRIDVNARYVVELNDVTEVRNFLKSPLASVRPRLVLGGGSNVLFTKDYEGIVIRPVIRGFEKIAEDKEHVLVRAGAGEEWDGFVAYCVGSDFGGVENLSLIPGTVGASPVQNIGAYGVEAGEVIEKVEGILVEDGKKVQLTARECLFSYRDSIFKNQLKDKVIITHVTFRLQKKHRFKTTYPDLEKELDNYAETTIQSIRQAVITVRNNKLPDPAVLGNAGSFFKNPLVSKDKAISLRTHFPAIQIYDCGNGSMKVSAAWLIDQSGWKGKKLGQAGTYKKQPLILVNYGGATGEEIMQCAHKISKAVMNKFAVKLEMEVNVI